MENAKTSWEQQLLETCYATTDIYLASSLICAGFPMIDLFKKENQFTFYLSIDMGKGQSVYDAIESYWADTLNVSAKSLWSAYKEIKYRMIGKKREEENEQR